MAEQILNFPTKLSYTSPEMFDPTSINYVKWRPRETSFNASSTIEVQVESNTDYLEDAFISFDLTATAPTAGAAQLSSLGGAAVIKSVYEIIGGKALPQIDNVPLVYSSDFITDSPKRQALLNKTSYYVPPIVDGTHGSTFLTNPDGWTITANTSDTARICIPMCGHLKTANSAIPLPDIPGGNIYRFTLNNANDLFIGSNKPTNFTVTNFAIVAKMLRPSDSYLKEHQAALAAGVTMDLGLQMAATTSIALTTTTGAQTQQVRIQTGYKKSLDAILLDVRSANTFEGTSVLYNKVSGVYFTVGTQRYPTNFDLQLDKSDSAMLSALTVSSYDDTTNYDGLYSPYGYFIQNFKDDQNALFSGIPIEGGNVEASVTFNGATTVGAANAIYFYDGLMKISNEFITVLI